MMEYRTADGHVVDDALLDQEAEALERGERPEGWRAPTLPYREDSLSTGPATLRGMPSPSRPCGR